MEKVGESAGGLPACEREAVRGWDRSARAIAGRRPNKENLRPEIHSDQRSGESAGVVVQMLGRRQVGERGETGDKAGCAYGIRGANGGADRTDIRPQRGRGI